MAHIDIDLADFTLPDDFEVDWNAVSVPALNFAANASTLPIHQPAIGDDGINHFPIEVDDGLLAAPAIEFEPSRRINRGEWDLHQQEIETQYPLMTLPELRKFMAEKYTFFASEQQWKKKLAEWRLTKNLPPRVTRFIKRRARRRLAAEGKKTMFRLNQEAIPMDKIKRHVQSACVEREGTVSPTGSTPDQLSYQTYESPRPQPEVAEPLQQPLGNTQRKDSVASMTLWQAQNMDGLLDTARRAVEMSTNGDYLNAKPMFMEAIDGLNALLSPDQPQAIKVLESFVEQAVANKDFDEATTRLHISHNDHKDKIGSEDKMTWLSLARLGRLYREQFRNSQAYHMLFNSREGLLATTASAEDAYIFTHPITSQLIDIAVEQCNFAEAESESLKQISQVEALGSAYERDAALLKHGLVHLYCNANWREGEGSIAPSRPRTQIEETLLETMRNKGKFPGSEAVYICSCEQLREFYWETGQLAKLESLLPDLESIVEKTRSVHNHSTAMLEKILDLHAGIADSFRQLGNWEKAKSWLFRLKEKIEQSGSHGPQCISALSNIMHIARLYLDQGNVNNARHWFENAQQLGRKLLPLDHKFHDFVSKAIDEGILDSSSCMICLVNPGTNDMKPSSMAQLCGDVEKFSRSQDISQYPVHGHSNHPSRW